MKETNFNTLRILAIGGILFIILRVLPASVLAVLLRCVGVILAVGAIVVAVGFVAVFAGFIWFLVRFAELSQHESERESDEGDGLPS